MFADVTALDFAKIFVKVKVAVQSLCAQLYSIAIAKAAVAKGSSFGGL
jgi:hypothetical protein